MRKKKFTRQQSIFFGEDLLTVIKQDAKANGFNLSTQVRTIVRKHYMELRHDKTDGR